MKRITIERKRDGAKAEGLLLQKGEEQVALQSLIGKVIIVDGGWKKVRKIIQFSDTGRWGIYADSSRYYLQTNTPTTTEFLKALWKDMAILTDTEDEAILRVMQTVLKILDREISMWGEQEGWERALTRIQKRFRKSHEVIIEEVEK